MTTGVYNKLITIYKRQVTQDEIGQAVENLLTYKTCYAQMRFLSNALKYDANSGYVSTNTVFVIRYDRNVDYNSVISYQGQKYNVNGIQEMGRRVAQELTCSVWENLTENPQE